MKQPYKVWDRQTATMTQYTPRELYRIVVDYPHTHRQLEFVGMGEYAQADMIICRAGASSVAEIAAAGRVACFVPLPSAVDDHQTANAEYLTKADAGRLCPQANLAELAQYIMPYLTNSKARFQAAKLARQLSKSDATEQVCFIIKGLLDE